MATLGVWNVVSYPIEDFASSEDCVVFRVIYDDQERATKAEVQGG